MARLSIIAAVAENGAIGNKNQLIYHLSADLRRFKSLTTGHTVIMGRRTFESLPKGALPNRRNIVLSRTAQPADFPHCELYRSLQEALAHCGEQEQVYVIGGASLYREALPLAQRLCLTHVHATPAEADTFFPDYPANHWQETEREDCEGEPPYSFADYERA